MLDIINNSYLWIPIITWFAVQSFKFIYDLIKNKKLDVKRLYGSGGMPSSHSAVMISLATTVGLQEGFDSPLFAISFVFACVVMYDAAGVRRAAGKQAKVLNQIIENENENINVQEKLKELLGHTPLEVFVGAIVGMAFSLVLINLW